MVRRRERCELSRYTLDSLRRLGCIRRAVRPMKTEDTEDRRVCPSCGNEFSGAVEFCPVCMLHGALADDVESGESSSERVIKPKSQDVARRFQHYEVVVGEDGRLCRAGSRRDGRHLQSVRRRSSMPRDIESHQREISR